MSGDNSEIGISVAALVVSFISFIFWCVSFFMTERHHLLMKSFEQRQNYTTRNDHPWNIASWLFNAYQYPGLPFKIGQVEFLLDEEIFLYSTNEASTDISVVELPQSVKSAIKATLMDCCVELKSLVDLTKRGEVDRRYLRDMVNRLVYRLTTSQCDGVRVYGDVLQELADLYQLPFHVTINLPQNPDKVQTLECDFWFGKNPTDLNVPPLPPWKVFYFLTSTGKSH